jgi:hypothetical protein
VVIIHLYDKLNGHRYRKISYDYYCRLIPYNAEYLVEAWIVPETVDGV